MPVSPYSLVGDNWMNNPIDLRNFELGLLELDLALKPITDALDASERLTEADYRVYFNCRE